MRGPVKVFLDRPRTIGDYNLVPKRPERGNKSSPASDRKMITQALVDLGYLRKNKRAIKPWDHDPFMRFLGGTAKLILLVGVTEDELEWAQKIDTEFDSFKGTELLTELLRHAGHAPLTFKTRDSIFNERSFARIAREMIQLAKKKPKARVLLDRDGMPRLG